MRCFLSLFLDPLKDATIIILLVCAFLTLAFGIMQHGPKEGWFDGASIITAVFLVVALSAMSNFKQSRQFKKLSDESKDTKVQVVRDGRHYPVSIFNIVMGDVASLKIGDQVPADGLFVGGYCLKVDESGMTGESDHVDVSGSRNPFLMFGTKVADGFGSKLVKSVGMNTSWGEMPSCIIYDVKEQTPLQARLDKLASWISKIGLTVAIPTSLEAQGMKVATESMMEL
uniref:Calcium-transporting ATPase n=1 Tax=Rhizophora mucronata TaxID=61149 RepID=A0A2P2JES9_RHIMU